jgi:CysZ protein
MHAQPLGGPHYLNAGFKMIMRPGLRKFVLLPLSINIMVFFGLIYFSVQRFNGWVTQLMPNLPSWLSFLDYILWPLFVVLVLLIIFFTFTTIANLIASPFNSFLAEKVEVIARGEDHFPPFNWTELIAMVPRTLCGKYVNSAISYRAHWAC